VAGSNVASAVDCRGWITGGGTEVVELRMFAILLLKNVAKSSAENLDVDDR